MLHDEGSQDMLGRRAGMCRGWLDGHLVAWASRKSYHLPQRISNTNFNGMMIADLLHNLDFYFGAYRDVIDDCLVAW